MFSEILDWEDNDTKLLLLDTVECELEDNRRSLPASPSSPFLTFSSSLNVPFALVGIVRAFDAVSEMDLFTFVPDIGTCSLLATNPYAMCTSKCKYQKNILSRRAKLESTDFSRVIALSTENTNECGASRSTIRRSPRPLFFSSASKTSSTFNVFSFSSSKMLLVIYLLLLLLLAKRVIGAWLSSVRPGFLSFSRSIDRALVVVDAVRSLSRFSPLRRETFVR